MRPSVPTLVLAAIAVALVVAIVALAGPRRAPYNAASEACSSCTIGGSPQGKLLRQTPGAAQLRAAVQLGLKAAREQLRLLAAPRPAP